MDMKGSRLQGKAFEMPFHVSSGPQLKAMVKIQMSVLSIDRIDRTDHPIKR